MFNIIEREKKDRYSMKKNKEERMQELRLPPFCITQWK